ncbi:MAG: AMP-binding protein, partial [Defluviicoccus sp.]|nr:AMP-binding protein [Defluviicoccus sp.]
LEQFIGTTEMFHCFITASELGKPARAGTMGRAAPGYEVAVLDADTLGPVADGERGLLAVRGCTGTVYWRNEDRQRELVRDGWNVFPDVVTRDAEGYFQYVGRHDEMIVSAGYNISPIEVETALLGHEAVLDCACVPAPDPAGVRGAIVKAYVVAAPGHETGGELAARLQAHVKATAPPYMYPRAIEFLDALPKTPNGKVLRSELRTRAAAATSPDISCET